MKNRIEAKKKLKELLNSEFPYIYKEINVGINKRYLIFNMDSNKYALAMTFDFAEEYCDILAFISPRVLTNEYYKEVLYTINAINTYVKGFGRFYVDEFNDIAYSFRIPYTLLKKNERQVLREIETIIKYYEDVFNILLDAATGKRTAEESKEFLEKMWGAVKEKNYYRYSLSKYYNKS